VQLALATPLEGVVEVLHALVQVTLIVARISLPHFEKAAQN
jgi:hypothetical protein